MRILVLLLLALPAAMLGATTYSLVLGGCGPQVVLAGSTDQEVVTNNRGDTTACSSAAFVTAGKIGVSLHAFSGSLETGDGGFQSLNANLRTSDDFTIAGGPSNGYLLVQVVLDGRIDLLTFLTTNPSPTRATSDFLYVFGGQIIQDSHGRLGLGSSSIAEIIDIPATVRVPFFANVGNIAAQIQASVSCQSGGFEFCTADILAMNSAKVIGAEVYDLSGNAFPTASILSSSGFDYRAGYAQVIPEPSPIYFCLLGLTALALKARSCRQPMLETYQILPVGHRSSPLPADSFWRSCCINA